MKSKNLKKIKLKGIKRPFLLLEVLIAFTLLVMAILPLVYPHVVMLNSQKKFIQRIELDHLVNLLYVDVLERLHKNQIGWNQLENRDVFEIESDTLERVGNKNKLPYKGSYSFKEVKHKPKEKGSYTVYLYELTFKFNSTVDKQAEAIGYTYTLFVIRKLKEGIELPQPKEEKI